MASSDIGIDLGTASVLVYVRGKGVVLKEPSVVAYDKDTNEIKAIGEEARQMMGRTPGNIEAVRPLRQGVISDYTITEKMLRYFIQKAMATAEIGSSTAVVCMPVVSPIRSSIPKSILPPPVSKIPLVAMSAASSGGVSSST